MPIRARSTCHLRPGTGGARYLWGGALAPGITRVLTGDGVLYLLGGPWYLEGAYWEVLGCDGALGCTCVSVSGESPVFI